MPKRLSDITHLYERTAADLETAQDELTVATEHYRAKVEAAAHAHRAVANELTDYLREHPEEVIVANDYGYYYATQDRIGRRKVFWAHHVWVEDAEPAPTYRVPRDNGDAMVAAWNMGSEDPAEEAAS